MNSVKLGEIANITKLAGFEHTEYIQGNCTHIKTDEDDVPLFIGKTVRNGKIDTDFDWYISKSISDELERSRLYKKCIVLPYVGTVGDLAIFEGDYLAHLGSNVAKIELIDNCGYSEEFVYYFLKSPYGQKKLLRDIQGAVQKNITMEAIRNIELPIVCIKEQEKIISVLKSIDDKIDNNNIINFELKSMAKTIYDYWFLQFDFPDENGKPYKSSGGKMVWNEEVKREIPEGWEVKSIFDCMYTTYGLPLSTDYFNENEGIPVIRIRDILENTFSAFTTEKVEEQYLTLSKDLLVGMDGNFHMNFWAKDGDCVNQRIFRIRDKENVSVLQIYYEIAPYIKAREENVARSTVGHLSDKDFKALRIIVPNQKNIYETFDMLLTKICSNKKENRELTSLRDFLLPLLMNGQVGFKEN